MEAFQGIQIFTTNRLSDLDVASLCRCDYKLEFGYLKPHGIMIFYHKMLRPLVGAELEKRHANELPSVQGLTPGDFKVLRSKFRFKETAEVSHESMIASLSEETRAKEIHEGKKTIGF